MNIEAAWSGEATTLYVDPELGGEDNGTLQGDYDKVEFVVKCFIYLQDQTYDGGIDAVVEEIKQRLQDLDGLLAQHCIDINVYVAPAGGAAQ